MENMTEKLQQAGKKAEDQTKERRARDVRGSHLTAPILEKLRAGGFAESENTSFFKFVGASKGRKAYVLKKGGRVDFSGFEVTGEGVKVITEEEAKVKHLGAVRGQLDFEQADEVVLAALDRAIEELKVAPPAKNEVKETPAAEPNEAEAEASAS